MHKHFWKLEYSITLFVLLGVLLLVAPTSIDSTRQAGFIAKWQETYSRIEYVLKVINTHISDDMIKNFQTAKTNEDKEQLLLMILKPYMRLTPARLPHNYKVSFMNKDKVGKKDEFHFKEYYYSENGVIVGIKNVDTENSSGAFFRMMFDVNGMLPPNTWGKDVYGISIYDGKIEPFGAEMAQDKLPYDCSKNGTGLSCSHYYLIGGKFDE